VNCPDGHNRFAGYSGESVDCCDTGSISAAESSNWLPSVANTYATASKVATNADQFSLRIDHKLSAKNQFFARFTMDN